MFPSLRPNPPHIQRAWAWQLFVQNDLVPLTMVGLTWVWQLTKAGPIKFLLWEFGIKQYFSIKSLNWVNTETCAWGGHLLSQAQRNTGNLPSERKEWSDLQKIEARPGDERERERGWEYVHFPVSILHLILFSQPSKTIPTLAYICYNFSIFLRSNLQIFWHLNSFLLTFCYNRYIFSSPINKSHFLHLWFKFLPLFPSQGLHLFSYSLPLLFPICMNIFHPDT